MSSSIPLYSDFVQRFPALATMPGSFVQSFLDKAVALLDSYIWGDMYSEGVLLEAAHNAVLEYQIQQAGIDGAIQMAGGPVNSIGVAGISVGMDSITSQAKGFSQAWYSRTIYGQEFLRLRNIIAPIGYVTC